MGVGEARICVYLSWRLSPAHLRVVLARYVDVAKAFLGGLRGYSLTWNQLNNPNGRLTQEAHNCHYLLVVLSQMIKERGRLNYRSVHAACCAFNVPTHHLVTMLPEKHYDFVGEVAIRYTWPSGPMRTTNVKTRKTTSTVRNSSTDEVHQYAFSEHRRFELQQNYLERNAWCRYNHEIFCLARYVTRDFTRKIMVDSIEHHRTVTQIQRNRFGDTYRRVRKLLDEVFGAVYIHNVLSDGLTAAVYTLYLILHGLDQYCTPFAYRFKSIGTNNKKQQIIDVQSVSRKLDWYLTGRHQPELLPLNNIQQYPSLDLRSGTIIYPDLELVIHGNIQVTHLTMYSKMRMLHKTMGKSLVHTVMKKKTMSCSSYKTVPADSVLVTSNKLNCNIHGSDTPMVITLIIIGLYNNICGFDDLTTYTTSHSRASTHSYQNGVLNIHTYRKNAMKSYPVTCSKIPHFPALKMQGKCLLHRESVLLNLNNKGAVDKTIRDIYKMIRSSSEVDAKMSSELFHFELVAKEMIDNHVIGMYKIASLLGMSDVQKYITTKETLLTDRLLIGCNPKSNKSEFADKSKFDSETRWKSSKKIKLMDSTKDRKSFLKYLNSEFADMAIDYTNATSRGRWSFIDRINHTSDAVFYSPLTRQIIDRLTVSYDEQKYPDFHRMMQIMTDHLTTECGSV